MEALNSKLYDYLKAADRVLKFIMNCYYNRAIVTDDNMNEIFNFEKEYNLKEILKEYDFIVDEDKLKFKKLIRLKVEFNNLDFEFYLTTCRKFLAENENKNIGTIEGNLWYLCDRTLNIIQENDKLLFRYLERYTESREVINEYGDKPNTKEASTNEIKPLKLSYEVSGLIFDKLEGMKIIEKIDKRRFKQIFNGKKENKPKFEWKGTKGHLVYFMLELKKVFWKQSNTNTLKFINDSTSNLDISINNRDITLNDKKEYDKIINEIKTLQSPTNK